MKENSKYKGSTVPTTDETPIPVGTPSRPSTLSFVVFRDPKQDMEDRTSPVKGTRRPIFIQMTDTGDLPSFDFLFFLGFLAFV